MRQGGWSGRIHVGTGRICSASSKEIRGEWAVFVALVFAGRSVWVRARLRG